MTPRLLNAKNQPVTVELLRKSWVRARQLALKLTLSFLGKRTWLLQHFADKCNGSDYQAVLESEEKVNPKSTITLSLLPAGGYAGIISKSSN